MRILTPDKIVIHHSATPDGGSLSWTAIMNYHVQNNGWSDIGYHAGIEEVGNEFVCLFGRPSTIPGAHTIGENRRSLGFCFVGNYDHVEPTASRLRVAARRVLAPWLIRHRLSTRHLVPHSQFADKTCPGKLFSMDLLREIVAEEMQRV